ncbi:GGDEF domain-containing phosphodiesterase [Bacillus sp. PS06]|uniref:GGDEF domain-containing phosphodiesterase n=1 Tax=Bacillus sp. PS06 TaxID=2764176 RepID=UPI001784466D|nr:GGDEF domain-containing phosphodiesterase [Bacillus sp. PS06]MBD8069735.1 EAL domain-containing protein [Bacillus sp. PS06]
MSSVIYFLLSVIICFSLLSLNVYITNTSIKRNYKESTIAFFSAVICGSLLSLTTYFMYISASKIEVTFDNLLHLLRASLLSMLFYFPCFFLLNIMSKIPIKQFKKRNKKKQDASTYLALSIAQALFNLTFSTLFISSLGVPIVFIKELVISSLILLVAAIYTLIRVYQHLYIDKLVLKRNASKIIVFFLFLLFSISFNSSIYIFIISLLFKTSFIMGTVVLTSTVALFILTIYYVEKQLLYQQEQLEYKNNILDISEQQYRSIFDNTPNAVFTLDLAGNFTAVNPAVFPKTGFTFKELAHSKLTDFIIDEKKEEIQLILNDVYKGKNANFETVMRTKNNQFIQLKVTALPIKINNKITGAYFIGQNITKQLEMQKRIQLLAYHDDITGLLNRSGFYQKVESHIKSNTLSVALILDIDGFKDINNHLGHSVGDEFLKLIANRLSNSMGSDEIIGRIGGDVFAIYLTGNYPQHKVIEYIENIQRKMKDPFTVQESIKEISFCIGVAFYPKDGVDFFTLFRHADMAMYRAKQFGRSQFILYSPELEEEKLKQINMLQEMKFALQNEHFSLNFQPKHSSIDHKIVGVETLVRWYHPTKGFIPPDEFIPLAEKNGLIIPISNWIIQEACKIFSKWLKIYNVNFHLSINISPEHFLDEDFIDTLLQHLHKYQIPANMIDLEITENVAIDNTELTSTKINLLKKNGIQVSIDDFGTGYTSLTSLSKFNLDRIKIDRSFINGLPNNHNDVAIVQSLLSVTKHLNIIVTAEGVETAEQLNVLREWGCDEIQGYYFSKPLPQEKLIAYWLEFPYK